MYVIVTKDSNKAAEIIKQGRAVAFPTSTSYGLAVDGLQGFALQRLRNLKQRPADKTFTVFMKEALWSKFLQLTDNERKLLLAATNQPLTLLVKPTDDLAHLAQDGLVGLRVIDHPQMQALADLVQVPLTATSANIPGQETCLDIDCLKKQFPGKVDPLFPDLPDRLRGASDTTYDLSLGAILDGGTLPAKPPTTIAKIVGHEIQIIRSGFLTDIKLQKFL